MSEAGAAFRAAHGARQPRMAIVDPTMNGGKAVALIHGLSASGCQPSAHQSTAITSTHPRNVRTARYTSGESSMQATSACKNHSG